MINLKKFGVVIIACFIVLLTRHHSFANSFSSKHLTLSTGYQQLNDTIKGNDQFESHLSRILHYPPACKKDKTQGKMVVVFNVTTDKKIQNITPLKNPDDRLTDEVIRVLSDSSSSNKLEAGTYMIHIDFLLSGVKTKDHVNIVKVKTYDAPVLTGDIITLGDMAVTADVGD